MKFKPTLFVATLATAFVVAGTFAAKTHAADAKPKYTIEEAMKQGHKAPKGTDTTSKKASNGIATKEELATLVEMYASMAVQKPPQGDEAVWKKKTAELLAAAKSLQKGEAGAVEKYKAAVNCKACHEEFKPKK
ncbi:MAG TPA: hypothetical protein VK968_16735 [Roseimicrobium sp.]|nr:hypothetical protein [Roseimicrobium sp.]